MSAPKKLGMLIERVVKSSPPTSRLLIGITISLTRELTIVVSAPPTATPIARSMILPRLINSRNSFRKALSAISVTAWTMGATGVCSRSASGVALALLLALLLLRLVSSDVLVME